jgi:hypothetical protein
MSALRTKLISTLLVTGVAAPASAHAVHERREAVHAERELEQLTNALRPVMASTAGMDRVSINGASLRVRASTVNDKLDNVMRAVERDCSSGDYDVALGGDILPSEGDSRPIKLERIVSQEGEAGVRASLCIFARDPGSETNLANPHTPSRRVRYTLGHQLEDGRTAVTSVVQESTTPLADLFPADGDAPGSDSPDMPRPASARRMVTANVGTAGYTVRIYRSTLPIQGAIASYDQAVATAGYKTTGTLPTARMYSRDGKNFMASFLETTEGTAVTLAPYEAPGAKR